MCYLLKAVGHLSSDALCGRIGGNPLWMGRLQFLQPAELVVEVIVRHGRVVQHIVFIVGLLQLPAQGLDFQVFLHTSIPPLHI